MKKESLSRQDKARLKELLEPGNIRSNKPEQPNISEFLGYLYDYILKNESREVIIVLIEQAVKKHRYPQMILEYMITQLDLEYAKLAVAAEIMDDVKQQSRQQVLDAFIAYRPYIEKGTISAGDVAFYIAHGLIHGNAPVEEVFKILRDEGLLK